MKEVSNNLSPYILQNLGVVKALRFFLDKINYTDKLSIHLESNFESRLNEKIEITVYRLITELVNNTLKHADARNARVKILLHDNDLLVKYLDDGIGFNPEDVQQNKGGIGLFNMKSRIEKMGGVFDYKTGTGKGFELFVKLGIETLND